MCLVAPVGSWSGLDGTHTRWFKEQKRKKTGVPRAQSVPKNQNTYCWAPPFSLPCFLIVPEALGQVFNRPMEDILDPNSGTPSWAKHPVES